MTEKQKTIPELAKIAEKHLGVALPFYLKKTKDINKQISIFRYDTSTFYRSDFVISKPFYKMIHMPFNNEYYENDSDE
jgi:hypothetical protein